MLSVVSTAGSVVTIGSQCLTGHASPSPSGTRSPTTSRHPAAPSLPRRRRRRCQDSTEIPASQPFTNHRLISYSDSGVVGYKPKRLGPAVGEAISCNFPTDGCTLGTVQTSSVVPNSAKMGTSTQPPILYFFWKKIC